ncbi:MAG: PH domain-containing protein [Candidatus Sulfopaludibacter sp.]|nr:PH domain-containing protein [Candidatus Sulfopaludibacter sp.]
MAKTVSVIVAVTLALVAVLTRNVFVAGLGTTLVLLTFAWSPRGYTVEGQTLLVQRTIGTVRIPLQEIRELRAGAADDFEGAIRLFGNGGLFGYYGLFQTAKLGKCTWYVTNRSKAVVIVAGAKTVVVSPDDVDGFLAAVRSVVPVPVAATRSVASTAPIRRNFTGVLAAAGIVLVVVAIVAFATLYSPGPPGYTMTPQSLIIHDRFYPVTLQGADVDAARVRVVNLDSDTDWRPTARTNGFANAHYRSGHFRAANGETIRLYWADGRRLVLLPPKGSGTPVLLQTADPDGFVAAVRRAWQQSP